MTLQRSAAVCVAAAVLTLAACETESGEPAFRPTSPTAPTIRSVMCNVRYTQTDTNEHFSPRRDRFVPRFNVRYVCDGGNAAAQVLIVARVWSRGRLGGDFDSFLYLRPNQGEWLCHDNNSTVAPEFGCGFGPLISGQSRDSALWLPSGSSWNWKSETSVCSGGAVIGSANCPWPNPPTND